MKKLNSAVNSSIRPANTCKACSAFGFTGAARFSVLRFYFSYFSVGSAAI